MQKTAGVQTVSVSLNEGLTVLDLKEGNGVTLAQLRNVLKDSGFVSREARIEGRGVVSAKASELLLTLSGTNETFALIATSANAAVYAALRQRAIAGPLTVSRARGVANPPAKGAPTMAILAVDE